MGPAITRLAWRRVGAIVPACRQVTTTPVRKTFRDSNLPEPWPARINAYPSTYAGGVGYRTTRSGRHRPVTLPMFHFPHQARRLDSRLPYSGVAVMALTKLQLITDLAESTDLSKAQVRDLLDQLGS